MAVGYVATLTGWRLWVARLAYAGILALAVVTFLHAVPHWVSAALLPGTWRLYGSTLAPR